MLDKRDSMCTNTSSIYDVSKHIFKDIQSVHIVTLKMAKESVLHKAGNSVEKIQQRADFLTKNTHHVTRFGPYEIY